MPGYAAAHGFEHGLAASAPPALPTPWSAPAAPPPPHGQPSYVATPSGLRSAYLLEAPAVASPVMTPVPGARM